MERPVRITSDVHVVRKGGFLSLIEPNDIVMEDRGFPIQEDLMLHQATLEIPPGARGNRQMTRQNVKKSKTVANLRTICYCSSTMVQQLYNYAVYCSCI